MTKLVMYRNNSAYEQFLAPALVGFETQIFPQGTSETEITAWITGRADSIRSMEMVYLDQTCYEAGKLVNIWKDVKTNYGGLDHVFQKAVQSMMTKDTVEETIAEVVTHLLAKEVPTRVFVVMNRIGDHGIFKSVHKDYAGDYDRAEQVEAETLRVCLEKVTKKPVTVIKLLGFFSGFDENRELLKLLSSHETTWTFFDRHLKTDECGKFWDVFNEITSDATTTLFRVPIENLVEDAIAFGVNLNPEKLSKEIREAVATW